MTITLQDVAVILGLCIHGLPITGTCDIDWSLLCYELLGVTPPTYEIKRSAISTRWLCHQFSHPLVDSDDAILERYAQAFILGLIVVVLGETPQVNLDFGRSPPSKEPKDLEHDGLQEETLLDEGLLADPLGCRWRVALLWAQNPSCVFYGSLIWKT
ncbi:hypothetical protein AAG906_025798 [Vitis piasezkii]